MSKGNVRIYIRVSTEEQTIERQEHLIDDAKSQGFYIAGIYREKASGAVEDRPELQKLISELQPGDFVVAEKMDRISRLPIQDAERLIDQIRAKGARLLVPGIIDFSDIIEIAKQKGKYTGRKANKELHRKIIECHILNNPPLSISKTAKLLNTTVSMVTRVCGLYKIVIT
ncbi:recombinase family protein [Ruminobacter sp.]|uniref:recombinase family protein n=1 Tax=Ruminobacter sp. TaxID=2774296 RepID=UPI00257CBEC0|nr:recombinase family protein [Ruminobacter sp.]